MNAYETLGRRLPLDPAELERELDAVCVDLAPRETARLRRRLRLANRHASLLAALPAPRVPRAELDRRVLGRVHDEVVREVEQRLRTDSRGDCLAEGFAPVAAPNDVDWAAAVLEHVADRAEAAAADGADDPMATPGWLWSRIRSDLRRYRLERRRFARRRVAVRMGLAAATIAFTVVLAHVMVGDALFGRRGVPADDVDVRFFQVDRPLASGYSTIEFARRIRDGQR